MTITAKEPRASESNHWYTRDGVPRYTVIGKNGKERNTTLRDARTENLVPSVTTVLNVMAKPALIQWLQKQVLMAALTLPRIPGEPEEAYIDRIMVDSKEQGRAAADAGTDIHASIQGFYEGEVITRHEAHVKGTVAALDAIFGQRGWIAERAFGHSHGFGGKCDLHCTTGDGIVADVKTKEFSDGNKVDAYDDHLMQLAALDKVLLKNAQQWHKEQKKDDSKWIAAVESAGKSSAKNKYGFSDVFKRARDRVKAQGMPESE